MTEEHEITGIAHKNTLALFLGSVLVVVLIFVWGYAIGLRYGTKVSSTEWATKFMQGTYALDDSWIGVENPKARNDVAQAARVSGAVDSFEVDYTDIASGGDLIVANTNRNGKRYKEIITLGGGRLQGFSSTLVQGDR